MAARETERSGSGGGAGSQDNPLGELVGYLALAVGWFVPGAAHFLIGEKGRGILFGVTLHLLFFAGLFIGGIKAIRPPEQPIWTYTQYLAGWPMLVSTMVQNLVIPPVAYAPKTQDVGSVYCGIAGMLNLLVLFDALVRVAGGHVNQRQDAEDAAKEAGGGGEK